MKIEYTFRESTITPITVAKFSLSESDVEIDVGLSVVGLSIDKQCILFNTPEWEQFTALINRINRQIGNE